jgi:hypothetical protein
VDEETDEEKECPSCHETGWYEGRHRCMLCEDHDAEIRDGVQEQATTPGVYALRYRTSGSYDTFGMEPLIRPLLPEQVGVEGDHAH